MMLVRAGQYVRTLAVDHAATTQENAVWTNSALSMRAQVVVLRGTSAIGT